MDAQALVVGIDVSKAELVVSSYGSGKKKRDRQRIEQSDGAIAAFVASVKKDRVRLVAVESTGGYERRVLKALHGAGVPCAMLQPELVRSFAKSQSSRAKTDDIDCEMIARFAALTPTKLWEPAPAHIEAAVALGRYRDGLIRERTREKNRLKALVNPLVRELCEDHIRILTKKAAILEKELLLQMKQAPESIARFELLLTVPGVGRLTASRLVAELPELGTKEWRKLSSLAGLAPMNRDSGESEGKRRCAPGRRTVRTALYQAAHSAVQFNPMIHAFYVHLTGRGKDRKVALVACAHKLLRVVNAMIQHGKAWDPTRHTQSNMELDEAEREALNKALADLEASGAAEERDLTAAPPAKTTAKPTAETTAKPPTKTTAKPPTKTTAKPPTKTTAKPSNKTPEPAESIGSGGGPTRPVQSIQHR